MHRRRGEKGTIPHRNGRFHCINQQWFFSTREQRLVGPYRDQDEAEKALERQLLPPIAKRFNRFGQ
ncbi:MAG: DUF6316 family protein [Nitrococcus sp.]|nr:DUF6316 family protein [Nitrococcus sp.]